MVNGVVSQESYQADWKLQPARYFVAQGFGGGWLIFQEGLSRAIHKVQRKILAVETAKSIAREHSPSQVLVEHKDGRFFLKCDFGPSGECRSY